MQSVNLNLIPGSVLPVINVSQYDSGRQFQLAVYEGASTYSLTGKTVEIRGTKPNMHGFAYGTSDGVISVSGNVVTVTTNQQMTAVGGKTMAELRITSGTTVIGTLNFVIAVEPAALADDTIISDTDIPVIERNLEAAVASAEANALKAEGYAVGEQNGEAVGSGSEYYQNNAEYYNTQAHNAASSAGSSASSASTDALKAEGYAVGKQNGAAVGSDSPYYHNSAEYYNTQAGNSATNAGNSATSAGNSATTAAADALESEGYANGEQNGAPVGSGSPYYHNNAKYWRDQAASYAAGGLHFMGTIAFASIPTTGLTDGDMYNISDSFTTDSRFVEGAGITVQAGSDIVWIAAQSKWDILATGGGTSVPSGGTTSQALLKNSNSDGDVKWADVVLPAEIAPVEASTTASQNYAIDCLFYLGGVLYKATDYIAKNGAITFGTNCTTATVEDKINAFRTLYEDEIHGVNLFDYNKEYTSSYSTVTPLSNGIRVTTNNGNPWSQAAFLFDKLDKNKKYRLTANAVASNGGVSGIKTFYSDDGVNYTADAQLWNQTEFSVVLDTSAHSYYWVNLYSNGSNSAVSAGGKVDYTNLMLKDESIESSFKHYNPQSIQHQLNAQTGVLGVRNLLNNVGITQVLRSIQITVNDDKSVSFGAGTVTGGYLDFVIFGTAASSAGASPLPSSMKAGKSYKISCKGATNDLYMAMYVWDNSNGNQKNWSVKSDEPVIITLPSTAQKMMLELYSVTGKTLPATTLYPMITEVTDPDDTYEPHAMTNRELTGLVQSKIILYWSNHYATNDEITLLDSIDNFRKLTFVLNKNDSSSGLQYQDVLIHPQGFGTNNNHALLIEYISNTAHFITIQRVNSTKIKIINSDLESSDYGIRYIVGWN